MSFSWGVLSFSVPHAEGFQSLHHQASVPFSWAFVHGLHARFRSGLRKREGERDRDERRVSGDQLWREAIPLVWIELKEKPQRRSFSQGAIRKLLSLPLTCKFVFLTCESDVIHLNSLTCSRELWEARLRLYRRRFCRHILSMYSPKILISLLGLSTRVFEFEVPGAGQQLGPRLLAAQRQFLPWFSTCILMGFDECDARTAISQCSFEKNIEYFYIDILNILFFHERTSW